ncbi:MAG: hypothetical protein KF746_14665 [Chitinophagaceae bacterium]|nr:hypothetical protein [Chitinophagaceae bacterium]
MPSIITYPKFIKKLEARDMNRFKQLRHLKTIEPVSLFRVIDGATEPWEIQVREE